MMQTAAEHSTGVRRIPKELCQCDHAEAATRSTEKFAAAK
jgi:hypothetical protein